MYERETDGAPGSYFSEVLSEELSIALAKEENREPFHSSTKQYGDDAVLSVTDPKTGESFYIRSNGGSIFSRNSNGATVRIIRVLQQIEKSDHDGIFLIRSVALRDGQLLVTVGSNTEVMVDRKTGKVISISSK